MTQRQATDLAKEIARDVMKSITTYCEAGATGDIDLLKRTVCVQLANMSHEEQR